MVISMGKVIPFPTKTEADKLKTQLRMHEEEIKMCLDDLESINGHIVELTIEYENMLRRMCELYGVPLPEEFLEGDN